MQGGHHRQCQDEPGATAAEPAPRPPLLQEDVTCEDVLGHHMHLHLDRVLGGVGDLRADMRHLANAHGRQKVRALHPGQRSHAALLQRPEAGQSSQGPTLDIIP